MPSALKQKGIINSTGVINACVFLCLIAISVLPIVALLFEAFKDINQGLDSPLVRVLLQSQSWQALFHSLYTSLLGTLISCLLGGLFAFTVVLCDVRAKAALLFCFMLPMMIPPQVTALSWVQLFGPASPLLNTLNLAPPLGTPQPLYSPEGIALLMGIQHAPLFFLALRASLLNIPKDMIEAARISGANWWQIFSQMMIPLCRYGLIAGISIAFLSCLGNFGIPAMLGIPVSYYVLPTLIYQSMAGFGNSVMAEMASLSLFIGLLAFLGVIWQQQVSRNQRFNLIGHAGHHQRIKLHSKRIMVEIMLWLIISIVLIAPLVALVVSSLVPALGVPLTVETVSLGAFKEMLNAQGVTWRASTNSVFLASSAAVILMFFSVLLIQITKYLPKKWLLGISFLIELPYALPGIVLSVACILLFVRPIPILDVSLYGTLGIILFAYLSRFLSVALKPVNASVTQLDSSLEEAAQLCGASALMRLKDIVLPLIAPAVFAGGLLVFLIAVNELTVSALLWSAGNETLGVLIYNLDESGESTLASAVAVMIVAMVALLMLLLSAFSAKLPKGVIPWQS